MTRPKRSKFLLEPLEDRICLDSSTPPPAYPGAPITLPTGAWTSSPFNGSPIFADLLGNGKQELLVEAAGGKLIAYGTNGAGEPVVEFREYDSSPLPNGQQANFKSTPVVVNVPGIGAVIVAALGRDENNSGTIEDGRVYAWNAATGAVLWVQSTSLPAVAPASNPANDSGVTGALTIGYLAANGQPDVVVDSFSTLVSAFQVSNGAKLWQFENDETVEPGAVVADLYGDGKQEVILDSSIASSAYPQGGYITILNGSDGSLLRRIYVGPEGFFGSPIVADLFGNGQLEIIAATGPFFNTYSGFDAQQQAAARAAGDKIYAFYPNGATVPGWPYQTTSNLSLDRQTWKEPIAADLYGNGQDEILDIDRAGVLHVISPYGKDEPGFGPYGLQINPSVPYVEGNGGDDFSTPIVADVTGSGQQDIVVSRGYFIAVYDNKGDELWSTTTTYPSNLENAAAYGQFDPTGPPVLAFAPQGPGNVNNGAPSEVEIFQLPATDAPPAWPMLRDNAQGQAIAYSTTAEAHFVVNAYQALFLRAPTQAEINYYVPLLTSKALTTFDLAAKLAKAPEGVGNFPGSLNISDADTIAKATKIYNILGFTSIPPDSEASILFDAHRGRTYDAMAILIVGSQGDYAATNYVASWAATAYRDIFNLQPSPSEIATLVRQVDGGEAMSDVAKGLLYSSDARKGYVISQIAHYLGRSATSSDLTLANQASFPTRESVVVAIVSSPEFYADSGGTATSFVDAAYEKILGVAAAQLPDFGSAPATLANELSSGQTTRGAIAQSLVASPLYYNTFVVASLFEYLPNPAAGILRAQYGSPAGAAATNPNPNLVSIYQNALVSGQLSQESVIASMMSNPQYVNDADSFRGFYVQPGLRE